MVSVLAQLGRFVLNTIAIAGLLLLALMVFGPALVIHPIGQLLAAFA